MRFNEVLEILVIVITALFAVIKFQLYEVFIRRYNTEMKVEQKYIKDEKKIYLVCTYIIENIGEIPIKLSEVLLEFYEAKEPDSEFTQKMEKLICRKKEDENVESLLENKFKNTEYPDLMRISAGEWAEFPIRAILDASQYKHKAIFIYGSFKWDDYDDKNSIWNNRFIKPIVKVIINLINLISRLIMWLIRFLGLGGIIDSVIPHQKKPANYHHTVLISTKDV